MPRSVKHGGKKTSRYTYKKNAARAKKKALQKKRAKVECSVIKSEWNKKKSVKQNLESMGLVYDVNKAIKLLPDVPMNEEVEEMDVEEAAKLGSIKQQKKKAEKKQVIADDGKAERVVKALEKHVVEEEKRIRRGRKFRLLEKDIDFCVTMIKRHDEDYEAMSRDPKNTYQNTPQQIQRKLRIFKQSPDYLKHFSRS